MVVAGMIRTLVKVVAIAIGVVVLLVVGLTLLLNTGAVTNRVKDLVVPKVSAALGRQLSVEDARLRIFPRPGVSLGNATLAGRPGEPPLVHLDSFQVRLQLWPLVRSLGKDIQVEGIRLVHPVINLVRARDGSWNYEGIGQTGGLGPAPKAKPALPNPAHAKGQPSQAPTANVVVAHAAIEDGQVQLIDHLASGQAAVAVSQIEFSADHVGLGQPLDATLSAAIAGTKKNFEARLHAARLQADLTDGYPEIDGELTLDGLDLAQLRGFMPPSVTGMMNGGRVDAQAKLSTQANQYKVDGGGKLSHVLVRGQPAEGSFDVHALVDPATAVIHATIDKLKVKGPGVDLGGRVTYDSKPMRVRFAIAGPLLDLEQVMGILPPSAPAPKAPPNTPLLTAQQRQTVAATDVSGTIEIQKVIRGALVASDFKAKAVLERGVFVLQQATAGFFGGTVNASGTRVDLGQAQPRWSLKANLQSIDTGQALQAFTHAAPVTGKSNFELDLAGAGVDWPTLQKAVTGDGTLGIKQGELTSADLNGKVLGAVAQGLQAAGKGGAAQKVGGAAGAKTDLRDLSVAFTIRDGFMNINKPIAFAAPYGGTKLGGKIGLDGNLALEGTATLSRETLQRILGGTGIPAPASLDVPLRIGGPLDSPSVSVDAQQAVASLVSGVAKQQLKKVQDEVQNRIKDKAGQGLGNLFKGFGR